MNRFGKVDEGTTVTDYDDEAIAESTRSRRRSPSSNGTSTRSTSSTRPAWAIFCPTRARRCASPKRRWSSSTPSAGVQVSTEKVWAEADEAQLPRLVVCNRLDRERASLERALESMRTTLGRNCIPVQLPIGEEQDFKGVVDLVAMKAYLFAADDSGKMTESAGARTSSPAGAKSAREALIEMVAEADDALMEKFFEAGTLTQEELTAGLAPRGPCRPAVPGVVHVGLRNIGIQPIADAIVTYVPSPAERPIRRDAMPAGGETARAADDKAPLVLWVWKTMADPFAGRITLFRVVSGVLKSDATVQNLSAGPPERFGHVLVRAGQDADACAGAARRRPRRRRQAQGHAHGRHARRQERRIHRAAAQVPGAGARLRHRAEEPRRRGQDRHRPCSGSARRTRRSATRRDPQTHELLLSGQGQLHIEVTVAKLRRRFGVEVNLKPPRIPYRETITAKVEAHGRHKKQTGGHGQFGDCKIRMEPLPRGADFEFVDDIFGGAIPRQFVPAVEKGIQETRAARLPDDLPGGRFPRDRDGRVVPRRRLERNGVQAGRPAGVPGRDVTRAADDPRAHHERRGVRAVGFRRRPDGRPQQPARPHFGHGHARAGDGDQGHRADGRDADLRADAHVDTPAGAARTTWSSRTTTRCRATCTRRSSRRRRPSEGEAKEEEE